MLAVADPRPFFFFFFLFFLRKTQDAGSVEECFRDSFGPTDDPPASRLGMRRTMKMQSTCTHIMRSNRLASESEQPSYLPLCEKTFILFYFFFPSPNHCQKDATVAAASMTKSPRKDDRHVGEGRSDTALSRAPQQGKKAFPEAKDLHLPL